LGHDIRSHPRPLALFGRNDDRAQHPTPVAANAPELDFSTAQLGYHLDARILAAMYGRAKPDLLRKLILLA
jgi:hypothetical protein